MKVLVVDDEKNIRLTRAACLEAMGFTVAAAAIASRIVVKESVS